MAPYLVEAIVNIKSTTKFGFLVATIVCGWALAEREQREGLVYVLTGKAWKNARAALRDQKRWEGYAIFYGAVAVLLEAMHF
jgi:hypothetical protein